MELSPEQLTETKKQLIEQIKTTFPEDKQKEAVAQIETMDDEQLVEFLKQNKLIKENGETGSSCIFCSIIFGETPSTKIAENEKAIAILEINPISEGHTIIIPKNHLKEEKEIDAETKQLAEQVKEIIQNSLNPKEIQLIPGNVMGHQIINILPIYDNETIGSQRSQKTPEDLTKLRDQITSKGTEQKQEPETQESPEEEQKEINNDNTILPNKIP